MVCGQGNEDTCRLTRRKEGRKEGRKGGRKMVLQLTHGCKGARVEIDLNCVIEGESIGKG